MVLLPRVGDRRVTHRGTAPRLRGSPRYPSRYRSPSLAITDGPQRRRDTENHDLAIEAARSPSLCCSPSWGLALARYPSSCRSPSSRITDGPQRRRDTEEAQRRRLGQSRQRVVISVLLPVAGDHRVTHRGTAAPRRRSRAGSVGALPTSVLLPSSRITDGPQRRRDTEEATENTTLPIEAARSVSVLLPHWGYRVGRHRGPPHFLRLCSSYVFAGDREHRSAGQRGRDREHRSVGLRNHPSGAARRRGTRSTR